MRIFSCCSGGAVKTWTAETGHELLTLKAGSGTFRNARFRPDGQRIVSCGGEEAVFGDARPWTPEQRAAQHLAVLNRVADEVRTLYRPDDYANALSLLGF